MSEPSETINRLEQWVEHWAPHYPEEFIADLRALLNTAKAAQRALQVLQKAQQYDLEPARLYQSESMVSNDYGDWLEFDEVAKTIQVLEGQQ